ncbi:MAG: zinc transporter ZntB [Candidatus Krumholzibacteria bacterium]|nr:zinc transporter ZntB [Candidatus Krumholzibacteria bacterium]
MKEEKGLLAAYLLDGRGGGKQLQWSDVKNWTSDAGTLWVHLDYTHPEATKWLEEDSGLDPAAAAALTADETRPRSVPGHGGLLVILRGVNLNPGSDPEDMVALRMWVEEHRIITTRHRSVKAIDAVRATLEAGDGPLNSSGFLIEVADGLTSRIGTVLSELDDRVDGLEDEVLGAESYELRSKIGSLRRETISLRRYLAPQRDAVARLQNERVAWLDEISRVHLREIADRTTRYVEDLDSARDRAAVTQDELNSRLSERMNKTMYVLSIVAGIFLPLGLLTGLLGINVGGIPGTESPLAFLVVCAALVVIAVLQMILFKRMRWL